jgi:DNA polymerase-3 subunit gamma/tau
MEYRVLARKYRPTNFDDLIGQEVLVRTLSNAIERNRVAHAFLLHGIRGIGKTTTARIIAKALNCIGEDGQGGPTIKPCGVCANCVAITEDRHIDVMEMDAASRTGVDDIRELIETVHYAPGQARTKVYIIDEVHMLSKSAFNALLKTLEEPPEHVKFIFATTELRKIPITILSRCQKFDLRRVEVEELTAHLQRICEKEQVTVPKEELTLIAAAAEGSVRDSLSMLDQAIALGDEAEGKTEVAAGKVAQMLGLADRSRTVSLLEHLYAGEVAPALEGLRAQYADGNDPAQVLQDALERVHEITLIKTATQAPGAEMAPEYSRLQELAAKLSLGILTRSWQILTKGLQEMTQVSNALAAAEMILIRLAHLSDLPDPGQLIKKLKAEQGQGASSAPVSTVPAAAAPAPVAVANENALEDAQRSEDFADFSSVVALFKRKREPMLAHQLYTEARLVSFAKGKIELNLGQNVGRDVPAEISAKLQEWSGESWVVALSQVEGAPSLRDQAQAEKEAKEAELKTHPLVQKALEAFPGSEIKEVHL